jgi:hypothetical protein
MQTNIASRPWASYFSLVSALLLFLSVVAFSDNLFTNVGQASNRDPKFIVHGLFGLAWYVLLVTQANLGRVRNLRLHRKVGVATFIAAIGVTLSTLTIFVAVWKGWGNMSVEARANRLLLPAYATCLLMAWQYRSRPDWHKRLVFVGTFFMLGPVLGRAYDPLIVSWAESLPVLNIQQVDELAFQLFFWGAWTGFFLSLAIYDRKTQRRVHRVTAAGFAWFVVAWLISGFT